MRRYIALVPILVASLLVALPGNAAAIESVPALQWPAPSISSRVETTLTHVSGVVTTSCEPTTSSNLKTYSLQGQVVRNLPQSQVVDGVPNCMPYPSVDKNGDLYGVRMGYVSGSLKVGSEVVAYRDSTVKWKYPTNCGNRVVIPKAGADGNIYFVNGDKHLIGLSPEAETGTTRPKKVLDIPTSVSCEPVVPFRGGIAVISQGWAYYYTYGGKSLGMKNGAPSAEDSGINAEGRLFFPTFVGSGSVRGIKVSAYDPFKQEVSWTAPEASFGQAVDLFHVHSAPDGGVLTVIGRTKIVAGAPTTERTYALVKIGPTGLKMWDKDLLNRDGDGNTFINASVTIDAGGRAVITRNASLRTSNSAWRQGISIEVLSPSGTQLYQKIMHGNLDATSGELTGYTFGSGGYRQPTIGLNTLFLRAAKCKGSDCSVPVEPKLYPIAIPGLGMDYPRSHVITRSPRPLAAYIALGDSFSSGEGVEPFDVGTTIKNVNECHRSSLAYPRTIAGSSPKIPALSNGSFRACSGAQTTHLTDIPQWNEDTQLDLWSDRTTTLVTLTIGGNDIGFADFGNACFWNNCEEGTTAYEVATDKLRLLPSKLAETYRRVLNSAPNARIFVPNYPRVVPYKSENDPDDVRCYYLKGGSTKWAEARAAYKIVDELNAKILEAVNTVRRESPENSRLQLVDVNGANSPFKTHEICGLSNTSFFQNINQGANDIAYVFHPNMYGQDAYATVIATAINNAN